MKIKPPDPARWRQSLAEAHRIRQEKLRAQLWKMVMEPGGVAASMKVGSLWKVKSDEFVGMGMPKGSIFMVVSHEDELLEKPKAFFFMIKVLIAAEKVETLYFDAADLAFDYWLKWFERLNDEARA